MTKKYIDEFVFCAIAHLQKAPITHSLENVPLMSKNISCSCSKYYTLLNRISFKFLVNFWNHEKTLPDLRGQNHCKMLDLCNIWPFIIIFFMD